MGYILGYVPIKQTAFGLVSFVNSVLEHSSLEEALLDLMEGTEKRFSIQRSGG